MVRKVVDFPAPLAPMSVTREPAGHAQGNPLEGGHGAVVHVQVVDLKHGSRSPRDTRRMTSGWRRISRGSSLRDLLPVIQDHDAIRDPHDDLHIVLHQEHGDTTAPDLVDGAREPLGLGGCEAGRWLVEHQERWAAPRGQWRPRGAAAHHTTGPAPAYRAEPTSAGTSARRRRGLGPPSSGGAGRPCARGPATRAARGAPARRS